MGTHDPLELVVNVQLSIRCGHCHRNLTHYAWEMDRTIYVYQCPDCVVKAMPRKKEGTDA